MIILGDQHSIANQFLNEIRDKEKQQDRMRFRKNMERMGEIMAYEISKKLDYAECTVNTPLASLNSKKLNPFGWMYLTCKGVGCGVWRLIVV